MAAKAPTSWHFPVIFKDSSVQSHGLQECSLLPQKTGNVYIWKESPCSAHAGKSSLLCTAILAFRLELWVSKPLGCKSQLQKEQVTRENPQFTLRLCYVTTHICIAQRKICKYLVSS